ncbi:MAG TPA: hypothetical protein VMF30_07575, partial [Pirellulales bacterium]|nr:hypothetical protein [Pirellulales bacterium]
MSTNESPDPTTQIVGAFERMAVPPAPSVQATIELLRRRAPAELEAHERAEIAQVAWKRFFNQGRELMRRPIPRMIAATAAGLMAFVVWSQFPDRQPEAQALEEIAKAIVAARTATFDTTIHVEGMPEQTAHCYFLAPGKSRTESKASVPDALIPEARHGKSQDNEIEFVVIADKQSGKSMLLSAAQKTATITHTLNQPAAMRADGMQIFEQMRDLLSKSPDATGKWLKPLGEKEIDGIRVLGFRCEAPNVSMTLWGDPKTGLPVLVETKVTKPMPMESTMSHFKLNVELKPELFDMTPPEGYTVRTTEIDASPATEESLVKMFALSARLNGNQFFDNLDRTSQLSLMKKQVE